MGKRRKQREEVGKKEGKEQRDKVMEGKRGERDETDTKAEQEWYK